MSNLIGKPMNTRESLAAASGMSARLEDEAITGHAHGLFRQFRAKDWKKNPKTGLLEPDYRWKDSALGRVIDEDSAELIGESEGLNVITNVGRIFIHKQAYDSSGLLSNGLNWIALSNDTLTEGAASTTLSNEIVANGLARAQGVVVIPTGSGTQTTIALTFTCSTAPQAAQKAALFNLNAAGVMQHALAFTQRSLLVGDTLATTFTITLT